VSAGALSLLVGYALVMRPIVVALLGAGAVFAALALSGTDVFLLSGLTVRPLADAVAERRFAAGLNVGSMLGLLILGAGSFRLLAAKSPRGIYAGGITAMLFTLWAVVAWLHAGSDPAITKELIRNLSIIVVALVALNAPDRRMIDRIPAVVVLSVIPPALVALYQLAAGIGFEGSRRVYGTLSHPNTAGALFAVGALVALWIYLENGRRKRYLAAGVLFTFALLATQSVGALGEVVVSVFVFAFLAYRRTPKIAVLTAVGIAILVVFATSSLGRERVKELQSTRSFSAAIDPRTFPTNSLEWRYGHWALEFRQWKQKPILGWGLGATLSFHMPDGFVAHSDPLRLLVETGILGFAVFGCALFLLLSRLKLIAAADPRAGSFAAASMAIMAGLLVNSLANDVSEQTAVMYVVAAVVGAALAGAPRTPAAAPR
jgi:O-antigen ligase